MAVPALADRARRPVIPVDADAVSVTTVCRNREAAVRFLQHVAVPDRLLSLAHVEGKLSILRHPPRAFLDDSPNPVIRALDRMAEVAEWWEPSRLSPELSNALARIWSDKAPPPPEGRGGGRR